MEKIITYLALGDSYTIGEAVLIQKNFPSQLVQMLRGQGLNAAAPEIIAKTGWTTDELLTAITDHNFLDAYDFVTLLIGVNNQYRGRSLDNYGEEFEVLLKMAVGFAGGDASRVVVLSIPDYGVTPFAAEMDAAKIAKEIDHYNEVNQAITFKYGALYIDITGGTREAGENPALVASDALHPSEMEYQRWAEKLSGLIRPVLK